MGSKKDITDQQKTRIAELLTSQKYSQREIAKKENVSRRSVHLIKRKMDQCEPVISNGRINCKGKRKTSQTTDRIIVQKSILNLESSAKAIKKELENEDIKLSLSTIRRRFYEANIRNRNPRKIPKLTRPMKKSRLQWAKLHQNYTVQDWEKVIFSNNSRLQSVEELKSFIKLDSGEEYNESCVEENDKLSPELTIWYCVSVFGPGPLHYVDGLMNPNNYKEVLQESLIPFIQSLDHSKGPFVFMQEDTPCHRAPSIQKFTDDNNILLLPWPSNSPDLNPIGCLWSLLKSMVYAKSNPSLSDFKLNIDIAWKSEEIKNLITSCIQNMPQRILEVIKAKGGSIH